MELILLTMDVVGSVLIGIAALRVHHRVMNEHKIDNRVVRSMRREQRFGILGIILLVTSFALSLLIGIY